MEKIALRFDGGEASNGRLHFYEYSRSQYATARFISTIEHFRRTGTIAERITQSSYVEILVETPREGSFLEVLLVKAQEVAATAISAPLSGLIALVWQLILPRNERTESNIVELARIRLAEEQERTEQERLRAAQVDRYMRILEQGNANTQDALELVRYALDSNNPALARADLDQRRLLEIQNELQQEESRQEEIDRARASVERIDPESLAKLSSRLRPMLPEMALPLKKSAESMSIEGGREGKPLILLNPRNIKEITEKRLDEQVSELTVRVKSYDRDRGVGKVSSVDLPRQLNFAVPPSEQQRLLRKILESMTRGTVVFVCRAYRDKDGQPTSLLLEDVRDVP